MHPCQNCGACCALFKVTFHWSELLSESYHVPEELQVIVSAEFCAMKGTEKHPIRCSALQGEVGKQVKCGIYERRPSPCRRFQPSYENGKKNSRCDYARGKLGLKPLTPKDW